MHSSMDGFNLDFIVVEENFEIYSFKMVGDAMSFFSAVSKIIVANYLIVADYLVSCLWQCCVRSFPFREREICIHYE